MRPSSPDAVSKYLVLNGARSAPVSVRSGIPQGSVLGLALFICQRPRRLCQMSYQAELIHLYPKTYGNGCGKALKSASQIQNLLNNLPILTAKKPAVILYTQKAGLQVQKWGQFMVLQ